MQLLCANTTNMFLWKSSRACARLLLTMATWTLAFRCGLGKLSSSGSSDLKTAMLEHLNLRDLPTFSREDFASYDVPLPAKIKYETLMQKYLHLENATLISRRQRSAEPSLAGLFRSAHKNSGIKGDILYSDTFREKLEFDMEDKIPKRSLVAAAELRLYKKLPNIITDSIAMTDNVPRSRNNRVQLYGNKRKRSKKIQNARVSIYHTIQQENGKERSTLIDSRVVMVNGSGWHSFDITKAVKEWQLHPVRFMSITLELHVDSVRPGRAASEVAKMVRFSGQNVPQTSPRRPELLVFTEERERTNSNDCSASPRSRGRKCCRESYFVNLRELPWATNWIIEPAAFDAHQCSGRCSASRHKDNRGATRSCTATETASLPVMYLVKRDGKTQVEVAELPNMIVKRCGCSSNGSFLE